MLEVPLLLRASVNIFSVTETAQRPLSEGLKKDTSVEPIAHFKPDLLVNKISLFIGIVI